MGKYENLIRELRLTCLRLSPPQSSSLKSSMEISSIQSNAQGNQCWLNVEGANQVPAFKIKATTPVP